MSDRPAAPVIRPLRVADADACDAIIRSLPYHFGHEGGRQSCAVAVRNEPGLVAIFEDQVTGFLTVQHHSSASAEITWMAVHAEHRRCGVGRALFERLATDLRATGCRLLLVHTLAASYDEGDVADGYAGTRAFYQRLGLIPAREYPDLWPGNPALLLVLPLDQSPGAREAR